MQRSKKLLVSLLRVLIGVPTISALALGILYVAGRSRPTISAGTLSAGILERSPGSHPGAVLEAPVLFRGLIYLSPVTEDEFCSAPEFLSHRNSRRTLVLHGGQDGRIDMSVVENSVPSLKRLGCQVQAKYFAEEDHYLVMSQPEAVVSEIGEFMRTD